MTIEEIDKRIKEYEAKLGKKIYKEKRKGVVNVGIPAHAKEYIKKEIAKLKEEKEFILSQKPYSVTVSWKNIRFENNQIRLLLNNHYTDPYPLADSRASFEYLKYYIEKARLEPILAEVKGNRIKSIRNLDQLNFVVQILLVKDRVNCYYDDFESTSIKSILARLKTIPNEYLVDFFKLSERTIFIHFLSSLQYKDYKIVPATELVIVNGKVSSEEESFLFTIQGNDNLYIIWESTSINKATYIFKSIDKDYVEDIQTLFDYIASIQSSKRRKLRYLSKTENNPFKSIAVLDHKNADVWRSQIQHLLR